MSSIDDVIHFLEAEIRITKQRLDCDCPGNVYNGVQVGFKETRKLMELHVAYCQGILDRIRSNSL